MASALKMLAQKAKKRLSTAGQSFVEIDKPTTAYLADGSYAIVAMYSGALDELFVAKNRSPLYVAECGGEFLVASDPICFVGFAKEYYSFNNYESGHIANGKIRFFDENMNEI